MAERTVFKNAPITEALLDVRVDLPSEITLKDLGDFHDAVKHSYPNKRERFYWQAGIQIKPNIPPELLPVDTGPDGYLFSSLDGARTVQSRKDGFTFNRFKPYDRWETFRDEAKTLWNNYLTASKPIRVTRVALRYINRIEIPLPMRDFKDYVLTIPEIAPDVPQALASFLMRLVIPVDELQATAIITQSVEPKENYNAVPLIFDIDVFHHCSIDAHSEEIWPIFERLHDLKNDIFFKSITDKTRELFN